MQSAKIDNLINSFHVAPVKPRGRKPKHAKPPVFKAKHYTTFGDEPWSYQAPVPERVVARTK